MPLEERKIQAKQPVNRLEHSINMDNREKLSITGVEDVASFSEDSVILVTNMGTLTVKGSELRINKLNVESGELMVEGSINQCEYSDEDAGRKSGGFFSKLFK